MFFSDVCRHGDKARQIFTLKEEGKKSAGPLCTQSHPTAGDEVPLNPPLPSVSLSGNDPLREANFYSFRFPETSSMGKLPFGFPGSRATGFTVSCEIHKVRFTFSMQESHSRFYPWERG